MSEPERSRRSKSLQKLDQEPIHLVRPLLLDPVAGAIEDVTAAQAGQSFGIGVELGLRGGKLQDAVATPGDEERGLTDRLAAPRRRLFPIAPEVAIPVEPAAKAGA